ncbi:MAG: radical SAM protein [Chloroflexota bacterium]|nr:radical SAM protein [Chloroflexota bacterium]
MKVLFIDPDFYHWGFSDPKSTTNFAFVVVGTYLKVHGQEVEILDMPGQKISYEELPQKIKERNPDIVGIPSSMNCYIPESLKVARIAKSVNPNIVTIGGGINFTLNSESIMKLCPELDFIVRGDGEYTALELVQTLEFSGEKNLSGILGLTWRDSESIILNSDRPPIMDLDSLPSPDWSLIDFNRYRLDLFPPKWGEQALFITSRGCPWNCRFCAPVRASQNTYREWSAERTVEELVRLRRKYGRRMIWMNDLTFGVNEDRTIKLCEGIIKEKLDLNICVDTRVDIVIKRKDILPLMRKAGFRLLAMGVESPLEKDQQKSEKIKPWMDMPASAKEAVKLLQKNKINSWCYHMWGESEHSPEDVRAIFKCADELDSDFLVLAHIVPHPGTPYYDEMKDDLVTDDLAWFGEDTPVLRNQYMTDNQMRMLYIEMYHNYFIKPSRLVRKLIFGTEYSRWWYKLMSDANKNWGIVLRQMWQERLGWQGFGTKEEEESLRKWARDVLGVPWSTRALMKLGDLLGRLFVRDELPTTLRSGLTCPQKTGPNTILDGGFYEQEDVWIRADHQQAGSSGNLTGRGTG